MEKKNKKSDRKPSEVPKEVSVDCLEPPDEYEDREEIRRLFAEEIEEREKEHEFYNWNITGD